MRLAAALAALSAVLVALGVGLAYPPAGLIVAGVQGLGAAYLIAFFDARRGRSRP